MPNHLGKKSKSRPNRRTLQQDLLHYILPTIPNIRQEDDPPQHFNFAAILNTFHVWAGARKSALPDWGHFDEKYLMDFIDFLNQLPQPKFPKVVVIPFEQICFDCRFKLQRLMTR